MRQGKRYGLVLLASLVAIGVATLGPLRALSAQPVLGSQAQLAQAQPSRVRRSDIWRVVYDRLPDFPREDNYRDRQINQASDSTLAQRLILYHTTGRGRSVYHRFDWKLTLADYLGANEVMTPALYPTSGRLDPDPLAGDRAAIQGLNRAQRDALVNLLVRLYNPRLPDVAPVTLPDKSPSPSPAEPTSPTQPDIQSPGLTPLPQPGDAELLLPR